MMTAVYIAAGVLAGVVVALKAIVPYTHSARLAAVEAKLEEIEGVVQGFLGQVPAPAPQAPTPKPKP